MEHEAEETGEPRVDEAIAGLGRLGDLPLEEHVAVFEDTHARLRQVLDELDAEPVGDAGPTGDAR
jgi:hypothetical protein